MIKNLKLFKVKYNPIIRAYSMLVVSEENRSSYAVTSASVKNDSDFLKEFFSKLGVEYRGGEDTSLLTDAIRQGAEFEGNIKGNTASIRLIDAVFEEDSFEKDYPFHNVASAILSAIHDVKEYIIEGAQPPTFKVITEDAEPSNEDMGPSQ